MKVLQVGIASVLVISLSAALPGLYHRTEGNNTNSPASHSLTRPDKSIEKLDLTSVQDLSKPEVRPEKLPTTSFSLERLSGAAQDRAEKILRVEINEAGKQRLQTLPGVGEVTAEAIIEHRRNNGPFTSLSELETIDRIGPAAVKKIGQKVLINGRAPEVSLPEPGEGSSEAGQLSIDINTATASDLQKIRGIGSVTAERILQYRKQHGTIENIEELTNVRGIGSATVETLRASTVN